MKYKKTQSYEAIQWTGENQKEVNEFLGEKFILKNHPIHSFEKDIHEKENGIYVDTVVDDSWIVKPSGRNEKPEVILDEYFQKNLFL